MDEKPEYINQGESQAGTDANPEKSETSEAPKGVSCVQKLSLNTIETYLKIAQGILEAVQKLDPALPYVTEAESILNDVEALLEKISVQE